MVFEKQRKEFRRIRKKRKGFKQLRPQKPGSIFSKDVVFIRVDWPAQRKYVEKVKHAIENKIKARKDKHATHALK